MTSGTGIPPLPRAPIARLIGTALARVFAVGQRLRPPRPIHSRGVVLSGTIAWIPDAESSGIAWIDRSPGHPVPVVARVSRSVGLPAPLPDVIGLALRTETDGRPVDLELASTGRGVPARFALLLHRRAERATLGALFPYQGPRGPVLLAARTHHGRPPATDPRELDSTDDTSWTLILAHATARGPWHPFARVELRLDLDQDDRGLRFDAVRHALPGAQTYAWVRAARQPSYVGVQPRAAGLRMP